MGAWRILATLVVSLVVVSAGWTQTYPLSETVQAGDCFRIRLDMSLSGEHFDTLALAGLLPGRAVSLGETWKIPNAVAQALCNFEGLTEQNLLGKLDEVKDQVARVTVTGSATGIDLGALAKLSVEATY